MGEVYRAIDERLQREIALKVLPACSASNPETAADARERLIAEARMASALNHPNICTVFDVGESAGRPYIAMELIDGRPLSALLNGEPLMTDDVLRYGIQIADGLAHAHEKRIVHCDLKSANVMIAPGGRVKILDFGLATRRQEECLEATVSHDDAPKIAGTMGYMAPEILRGSPPDSRSDVWAMGVVLYEMAAGHRPFIGKTGFELTSAILREPPAPLPEGMPVALQSVIQRCLAKDPGQRYQTAAEVRAALEASGSGSGLARPATAGIGLATQGRRRTARIAASLAVVLGGVATVFFATRTAGPRPSKIQSIAVLPLDNFSKDPDQEFFADGMTEQLISDLSKISSLRVISRTSVMQYKGTHKTLPEIAKELNVDAVVEGSVMRSGDRVRITAQLLNAPSDKHLWAETYDRDMKDILGIQSDVAQAVANEIRITLAPQPRRQVDPEVFQLYLRGQYAVSQASGEQARKGIGYLEQAIAKDPNFAPAYAALSLAYGGMSSIYAPPKEVMPKAKADAEKALSLDESVSDAHTALGKVHMLYDWDWDGANREFKRAIELNPSSATAHHLYGLYFNALHKSEPGIQELQKAQALDPLSLEITSDLLVSELMSRHYDETIAVSKKAIALHPNFAFAYIWLGMAHSQKGQYPEALAALKHARELNPSYTVDHFIAVVEASAGNKAEARRLGQRLEVAASHTYVCAYEVAEIHIALGDNNTAMKWMNRGAREQCDCLVWLSSEPWLDPLRVDPRYTLLMKQVYKDKIGDVKAQ